MKNNIADFRSRRKSQIQAARGQIPSELYLTGGTVLDVFSGQWLKKNLLIHHGMIVAAEDPSAFGTASIANHVVDVSGKWIVPGWIDAHTHVESSMMLPQAFERAVLSKGTTTAICDPHEIANVIGLPGIQYFVDSAKKLKMNLKVMMSSCVPATHLETNGAGIIDAEMLSAFRNEAPVLGLAEMMNVPGILNADESLLEKIDAFSDMAIDGHAPLLRGRDLSAYLVAGITSCHESSELEEAREKMQKGMSVWIREGSVAKDLHALIPLMNSHTSAVLGFCSDDRNPYDIAEEGHLDYLLREAIRAGAIPADVFRAASFSVARHYGLNQGQHRIGAIAPGYEADFVVLEDRESVSIFDVFRSGKTARSLFSDKSSITNEVDASALLNSIALQPLPTEAFHAPKGRVNVIHIIPGKIITEHRVCQSDEPGIAQLSVVSRYHSEARPQNAYVSGLGLNFKGAIASSVGHDSHNIIVAGSNPSDMAVAVAGLIEQKGGFTVAYQGAVKAALALPYGGLMSDRSPKELALAIQKLRLASRALGCELHDPFLQLAFLSLPVIPHLKLTDLGLVDVNRFEVIGVLV